MQKNYNNLAITQKFLYKNSKLTEKNNSCGTKLTDLNKIEDMLKTILQLQIKGIFKILVELQAMTV